MTPLGLCSEHLLGADHEDTHEEDAVLSSAASALNGRAAAAGAPALASLCLPSLMAYSNTLTSCISIPCGQTRCFYSPEDLLCKKVLKERDKRGLGRERWGETSHPVGSLRVLREGRAGEKSVCQGVGCRVPSSGQEGLRATPCTWRRAATPR